MKKFFSCFFVIWLVMFLLFNAVVFISLGNIVGFKNAESSFWIAYSFIVISFAGQLLCAKKAFQGDCKKLFYNMPLLSISYTGLITMTILGILMMIIGIPYWICLCLCLIILAFNVIAVAKAQLASDINSEIDEKIKTNTSFIRNLTVEAEIMMRKAKTENERKSLNQLYETIKYSDPVSKSELTEVESLIKSDFSSLKISFSEQTADKIMQELEERNKKCKLLK